MENNHLFVSLLEDFSLPKKIFHKNDVRILFEYAVLSYESKNYGLSLRILFLLTAIDPTNYDFWILQGICYQHVNKHAAAVACFSRCGILRERDPRPPYLAGISYAALGHRELALNAFESSLHWCASDVQYGQPFLDAVTTAVRLMRGNAC